MSDYTRNWVKFEFQTNNKYTFISRVFANSWDILKRWSFIMLKIGIVQHSTLCTPDFILTIRELTASNWFYKNEQEEESLMSRLHLTLAGKHLFKFGFRLRIGFKSQLSNLRNKSVWPKHRISLQWQTWRAITFRDNIRGMAVRFQGCSRMMLNGYRD